jgi:hypothetical protein
MVRLALSALLLLVLSLPAHAQTSCDQFRGVTQVGPSPITERIPAVAGERVYLCGYMLIHSGGPDLDLEISTGTGTNCATNKTLLLPRLSLPGGSAVVNRNPFAGEYTPVGNAVCTETFGSGTLTAVFYWAQF